MTPHRFFLESNAIFRIFADMRLIIKNMVCNHCVAAVKAALDSAGVTASHVELGRADIDRELTADELTDVAKRLEESGFELITDPAKDLVESIKREIIMMVRADTPPSVKLSHYLSERLRRDFRTLSRVFSENEGRTIENYAILQKIERVKELLLDGEMNISEIALHTGYSSVAHLSRQFKDITGMTPSEFRRDGHRLPLNSI